MTVIWYDHPFLLRCLGRDAVVESLGSNRVLVAKASLSNRGPSSSWCILQFDNDGQLIEREQIDPPAPLCEFNTGLRLLNSNRGFVYCVRFSRSRETNPFVTYRRIGDTGVEVWTYSLLTGVFRQYKEK
ncbi:hypothetical protein KIPB_001944 [Kipferlia bialata]|uniref:Uncharacterized protein n=1 Tax=Kipferlia bialata TaxID=797122 RepID=A0A391NM39_9EUKA|nr:hypothetical protein KIPB_001944 [Kipferlia bialata]|eukprot:g1944.t1